MIEFRDVAKVYPEGEREVCALDGVSLVVPLGQFVAVMGPSGSGKSTLLHLAGALDLPTRGDVRVGGRSIAAMGDGERTLLRRRGIGFVFQFFNLVPTLTVEENAGLPLLLDGARAPRIRERVRGLLDAVGLSHRASHRPDQLSGGEMQRVAIARALAADPPLLLADEPTGNLDSRTGRQIMDLLSRVVLDGKRTMAIVTHDPQVAAFARRVVTLRDGKIESDVLAPQAV